VIMTTSDFRTGSGPVCAARPAVAGFASFAGLLHACNAPPTVAALRFLLNSPDSAGFLSGAHGQLQKRTRSARE